ncbi:MAG: tRNA preQ1(34) S-adenosylmethionine ribosyltransferase-isomerase QueA [Deltaproteobacteria bacterium]|jgi:S-adenosylmethionine:tRNA ribosyltransferase-isomerase|nr:tRNA preQ1(34) S-adenosylmethionine ribosyltransferase-isomerase QueA [Deltaproteobacteria bacterium]
MYALSEYNYQLPAELIAQKPADRRDGSRLLVMDRVSGGLRHHRFYELGDFLRPGDVVVVNNTAVIPGRLIGKKDSGGRVEVLICNFNGTGRPPALKANPVFKCLIKSAKAPRSGAILYFDEQLTARVLERRDETYWVEFGANGDFESVLDRIGKIPLPPYIQRSAELKAPCDDRAAYQTVYATEKGAIAAPTAGLHFTPELMANLKTRGVAIAAITLHVGYGTFQPVRTQDIRHHRMHSERYSISSAAAQRINTARTAGHRVVAVGTTCVRTLEYAADTMGQVAAGSGDCDLFIYPGYRFKAVDAIITNFHLPESTLIVLVSAFAGRDNVLQAYQEAIKRRYRFYSYGDAMLII